MAAIRKLGPPLTITPKATLIGAKHHQPPPFRATGRGYFNRLPRFPADAKIANGLLVNHASSPSSEHHQIYLFVDAVETGWQLTGQTTQAQMSRSFYPRNMLQDELVIAGTVANQYEYDRLVAFVLSHHHSQFNPYSLTPTGLDDPGNNYPGTSFTLFRPQAGGTDQVPPMYVDMVINDIIAGHERFKNFPTYSLTCKVIYDHLDHVDLDLSRDLDYWTRVKDVFGPAKNPKISHGSDSGNQHSHPGPLPHGHRTS